MATIVELATLFADAFEERGRSGPTGPVCPAPWPACVIAA